MAEPRSRIYELALRARRAEPPGRRPARTARAHRRRWWRRAHAADPAGFLGRSSVGRDRARGDVVGLLGAVALVLASVYVPQPTRLAFSVNASATLAAIHDRDAEILEDEDLYHQTMIVTLTRRREGNQPIVDRLHTAFSVGLLGLLAELSGLAHGGASLLDEMAAQPQPQPAPAKLPPEPLPQTIFFTEKRGDTPAEPPREH
jgi:hypothetical protein